MNYLPLTLIINCIFIYFFRSKLGFVGIFSASIFNFTVSIFVLVYLLYTQLINSSYIFIDFGRWLFIYDLLDSNLCFIIDHLSLLSAILVLILTTIAQIFGIEYMYREAYVNRLLYLLNLFATSVLFLFFVFDFFLILIVWELIGLFSLLLVNFYSIRVYTIKAAFKTFFFSRISDFFISITFFFLIFTFNTTDLSLIFLQVPYYIFFNLYFGPVGFNLINLITFFIVISGAVKAAQFFFHVWLPDAMEAPTPASALIHSSTLVIMGVYLIIRCSIFFEFSYITNYFLIILGSLTIALGAISASFQNDIKKLVAYSTISQMGYLFCGCGFLCYTEVLFYLIIHALNKAFLFIIVGYIVHFFTGNTDLRYMGSSYMWTSDFAIILFFLNFNLAGLPLSAGFLAKELLVFQTMQSDLPIFFVRSLWYLSFVLTPFYMFYLSWSVFFRTKQGFIKMFNYNIYSIFSVRNKSNYVLNYSLFNSKTSSFAYLLVFLFINFTGEFLFLLLQDSIFIFKNITLTPLNWTLRNNFLTLNLLNHSSTINKILSYIVYLSLGTAVVLFFKFKRLNFLI